MRQIYGLTTNGHSVFCQVNSTASSCCQDILTCRNVHFASDVNVGTCTWWPTTIQIKSRCYALTIGVAFVAISTNVTSPTFFLLSVGICNCSGEVYSTVCAFKQSVRFNSLTCIIEQGLCLCLSVSSTCSVCVQSSNGSSNLSFRCIGVWAEVDSLYAFFCIDQSFVVSLSSLESSSCFAQSSDGSLVGLCCFFYSGIVLNCLVQSGLLRSSYNSICFIGKSCLSSSQCFLVSRLESLGRNSTPIGQTSIVEYSPVGCTIYSTLYADLQCAAFQKDNLTSCVTCVSASGNFVKSSFEVSCTCGIYEGCLSVVGIDLCCSICAISSNWEFIDTLRQVCYCLTNFKCVVPVLTTVGRAVLITRTCKGLVTTASCVCPCTVAQVVTIEVCTLNKESSINAILCGSSLKWSQVGSIAVCCRNQSPLSGLCSCVISECYIIVLASSDELSSIVNRINTFRNFFDSPTKSSTVVPRTVVSRTIQEVVSTTIWNLWVKSVFAVSKCNSIIQTFCSQCSVCTPSGTSCQILLSTLIKDVVLTVSEQRLNGSFVRNKLVVVVKFVDRIALFRNEFLHCTLYDNLCANLYVVNWSKVGTFKSFTAIALELLSFSASVGRNPVSNALVLIAEIVNLRNNTLNENSIAQGITSFNQGNSFSNGVGCFSCVFNVYWANILTLSIKSNFANLYRTVARCTCIVDGKSICRAICSNYRNVDIAGNKFVCDINYFTFCVLTLNGKSGRSNICYLIKCNDIIGYYSIDGRRCDRCYTFSILATTFDEIPTIIVVVEVGDGPCLSIFCGSPSLVISTNFCAIVVRTELDVDRKNIFGRTYGIRFFKISICNNNRATLSFIYTCSTIDR